MSPKSSCPSRRPSTTRCTRHTHANTSALLAPQTANVLQNFYASVHRSVFYAVSLAHRCLSLAFYRCTPLQSPPVRSSANTRLLRLPLVSARRKVIVLPLRKVLLKRQSIDAFKSALRSYLVNLQESTNSFLGHLLCSCVCLRERERESVCVREREREDMTKCVYSSMYVYAELLFDCCVFYPVPFHVL